MSTEIHPGVMVATRRVTKDLTDEELNALYMVSLMGTDPRPVIGYEKAKPLYTEQDGTRMHRDTQAAFSAIVTERFGG